MVRTKEAASKSRVVHVIEPDSSVPSIQAKEQEKESPISAKDGGRMATSSEEKAELPPLPKEREHNQAAITSFFMRTPVKKKGKEAFTEAVPEEVPEEKEERGTSSDEDNTSLLTRRTSIRKRKEASQSEEVRDVPKSQVTKKMQPRKSTRGSAQKELTLLDDQQQIEMAPVQGKETMTSTVSGRKRKVVEKKSTQAETSSPSKQLKKMKATEKRKEQAVEKEKQEASASKKKAEVKVVTVQPDQEGEVTTPSPSKKKPRKSELEKLDPSEESPGARLRTKKKVEEESAAAPKGKSKEKEVLDKGKAPIDEAKTQIPLRKKMVARKSKTARQLPTESAYFPFISQEAKARFEKVIKKKSVIKERALDWEAPHATSEVKEVIQKLAWGGLCADPGEAVLHIVKEFYANLQNDEDDKVFVRGVWVDISSEAINKVLKTRDFRVDEYFISAIKGVEEEELSKELCQKGKKITWTQGKNRKRNFHADALQPKKMPLFKLVCSRLIPTTHKSDVTMDRAVLLYAMVKNMNIDVGSLIRTTMSKAVMPSKALWYPALITKLCLNAGVKVAEGEIRLKPGQIISAKAPEEQIHFGRDKAATEILLEIKKIRDNQEKLLLFAQYQQNWNQSMMRLCKDTNTFPSFAKSLIAGKTTDGEGTSSRPQEGEKSKPMPKTTSDEEEDKEVWGPEDDIALDFNVENTGIFTTQADQSGSEEDNSSGN